MTRQPTTPQEHQPPVAAERAVPASGAVGHATLLILSIVILLVAALVSVRVGAAGMSWHDFFAAYVHNRGTTNDLIVRQLRGPRMAIAIEVGMALAVAGALIQGLTRNPLADPGILGINSGAALFVVFAIAVFGAKTPNQYVWFAFPGAAIGTGLSFSLAAVGRGRPSTVKLTLAGVVTGGILSAVTGIAIYLSPAVASDYRFWAIGDVGGRNATVVHAVTPFIIMGLLIGLPMGRALNNLGLGEDIARSLGQRIDWTRAQAILAVLLLAGSSVAAAGPIAFVGLVVPNAIRLLVGNDYRWTLPLSATIGATFLLGCDILARVLFRPVEIETGLVVSVIGAPIFIVLVTRRRMTRR